MAIQLDPTNLADSAADDGSQEVFINTSTKKIRLYAVSGIDSAGQQSENGVTIKCVYSFLKEQWKTDPNSKNLAAFDFPMVPITDEFFELVEGWDWYDSNTELLLRNGGWLVRNTSGNVIKHFAGVKSTGSTEPDDQLYYLLYTNATTFGTATNIGDVGSANQGVQIISDPNGDGAYGDGYFYDYNLKLFNRQYNQIYSIGSTLANGEASLLAPKVFGLDASTSADLNIEADDTGVLSAPYSQIKTRYFASAFTRDVDSTTDRNFGIVIDVGTHSGVDGSMTASGNSLSSAEGGIPIDGTFDGGVLTIHEGTNAGTYTIGTVVSATAVPITTTFPNTQSSISFTLQRATPVVATAEQIYTKVQYDLRQAADIDSSSGTSLPGKIADQLLTFVGSDLKCGALTPNNPEGGGSGVIIEGFSASDTNRITFFDNTATARTYPYVASLSIGIGSNLSADADGYYWVYFTYTHSAVNTGFAITSASGTTATLTSTTTDLSQILDNEEFLISGFATPANNGYYRATANGVTGSVAVEKVNPADGNFVNEATGASVTIKFNPFGSASGIVVQDSTGTDIKGSTFGVTSVVKGFAYDANVQGGRAFGVDAPVTIVGIGFSTSQYVQTTTSTGTIERSTTNSASLVASLERQYQNP